MNSFVARFVVPWMSSVRNNHFWTLLVVACAVVIWILIRYFDKKVYGKQSLIVLAFVIMVYLPFRLCGRYVFYGWKGVAYSDWMFLLGLAGELFVIKKRWEKNPKTIELHSLPFCEEHPTDRDDYRRENYAVVLAEKIAKTFYDGCLKEGAFTVLLNEKYGMGKSSFLKLLRYRVETLDMNWVDFKPWISSGPDKVVQNFFKVIAEEVGRSEVLLPKALKAYSDVVTEPISSGLAKHLSDRVGRPNKSMEKQYSEISAILKEQKRCLVVAVDDVDRLLPDELMALFKLIRNTADFPNVVYVLAADIESVKKTISIAGIEDTDLYVKKFFNMEMLFPACDCSATNDLKGQTKNVLEKFGYSQEEIKQCMGEIEKIEFIDCAFQNMRDVFRFINLLSFSMDVLKRQNILNDVCFADLYKITLIQFVDQTIYRVLRDHDDYLLQLTGSTRRLCLKKNYHEAFTDKQTIRLLKEIHQKKGHSSDESELDSQGVLTPSQAVEDAAPAKTEFVKKLVSDLFYDECNYRQKNRICFASEYFKFFAGRYRVGEKTNAEVNYLIQLPEREFKINLPELVQSPTLESVIHKMRWHVEDGQFDRLKMLKKVLLLFDAAYSSNVGMNYLKTKNDYFENKDFSNIVLNMYHVEDARKESATKEEIELHQHFFEEDARFEDLALVVAKMKLGEDYVSVFSDSMLAEWRKLIILRFINERVSVAPFEKDTLEAFYDVSQLNYECFKQLLSSIVRKSSNPMEWIYRFVCLQNGELKWDWQYVICVIRKKYYFDRFAKDVLGDSLDDDMFHDIEVLSLSNPICQYVIDDHPFFVAAKAWLETHDGE